MKNKIESSKNVVRIYSEPHFDDAEDILSDDEYLNMIWWAQVTHYDTHLELGLSTKDPRGQDASLRAYVKDGKVIFSVEK